MVDATGVGRAVVDMLRRPDIKAALLPVTITGGHDSRWDRTDGFHVAKKHLAGTLQALLQQGRLKISAMPERVTLMKELRAFRVKVNLKTGNEGFECLVAGTMVETDKGPVPIEFVKIGDRILTRQGYKKVLWSGETKQVMETTCLRLPDREIKTTYDHLVWVEGQGWKESAKIKTGDRLLTLEDYSCRELKTRYLEVETKARTPNPLCSTMSSTGGPHLMRIIRRLGVMKGTSYTEPFGHFTTARFQKAAKEHINISTLSGPLRNAMNAARITKKRERSIVSVPVNVLPQTESSDKPQPVYDLIVEDCHEFFANGILVHNSWREKDHDDLVLAAAIACWVAETGRAKRPGLRVFPFTSPEKPRQLRIAICSRVQLTELVADLPSILVSVRDPGEVADANGSIVCGMEKLLEHRALEFLDATPEEKVSVWEQSVPPTNRPASELLFNADHAKKVWLSLVRKRGGNPAPGLLVVADDGSKDRRAESLALAVCDALGLPRSQAVCKIGEDDWVAVGRKAPNEHVYLTMRQARVSV